MNLNKKVLIACDGACSGNGTDAAVGGWGVAVKRAGEIVKFSGYKASTTNNEMELTAMLESLKYTKNLDISPETDIEIYSDSAYVVSCFEDKWYLGWEKNGWMTSQKQPVKNRELWEALLAEYRAAIKRGIRLHIRKIKGHISGSEAAKWLAKYNKKYGLSMTAEEFEVALELNRTADELATSEYIDRTKKEIPRKIAFNKTHTRRSLYIIIPAAGTGERFGTIKQFTDIAGTPLLLLTIRNIIKSCTSGNFAIPLKKIVVAMRPEHIEHTQSLLSEFSNLCMVTLGGATRAESVQTAFAAINNEISDDDILAVHDGCRPFVTTELWTNLIDALNTADFALPVTPVTDTLKNKNTLQNHVREEFITVQTPQVMDIKSARKIYSETSGTFSAPTTARAATITDDSTIAAQLGLTIRTVQGSALNIKITTPEDAQLAAAITEYFKKM